MKLGIIGATGAVGKVFLDLLPNSNLNITELRLSASIRSIGKKINYQSHEYTIQENSDNFYSGLDFVFSSASSEVSKIAAEKSKEHNGDYLSTIMSQQTIFFKKLASCLNHTF